VQLSAVVDGLPQAAAALVADPPDVIVLDGAAAGSHLPAALARLDGVAPGCACLVLVEEVPTTPSVFPGQRRLVKGASPAELIDALEALIAARADDRSESD
jgi:hypothetical protein